MRQSGILKNKLFLYLTEFFAGMSVMAVELGAIFQLFTDRMDDYHRNDHDRDGAWKYLWWKECGQIAGSG